ncbi:MAG: STAS domain-containing protein [Candidatus Hinthialibacter sp.]
MYSAIDIDAHKWERFEIHIKRRGAAAIIEMRGRSNSTNVDRLDLELKQIQSDHIAWRIFDLSHSRLLNSRQIGIILQHFQETQNGGDAGFAFVNPTDRVRHLLSMTKIADVIPIFDSVDEAMLAFGCPK